MMQTDVLSAHTETTATLVTGRYRLKGYQCLSGGNAGDIIFKDGGASGVERLRFNCPATSIVPFANLIPGEGILFTESIHVTVPTDATVTIYYG